MPQHYPYTDANVSPGNTCWYKLQDVDFNGSFEFHGLISVTIDISTTVAEAKAGEKVSSEQYLVDSFQLRQNYPNPFNPSTTIQFDLIEAGNVSLSIYNSAGQLVRTLVSGDYAPGAHKVVWDARDNAGQRVANGLYLYVIKVGQQFTARRKLLLMK